MKNEIKVGESEALAGYYTIRLIYAKHLVQLVYVYFRDASTTFKVMQK
jgi:hypothetical protein